MKRASFHDLPVLSLVWDVKPMCHVGNLLMSYFSLPPSQCLGEKHKKKFCRKPTKTKGSQCLCHRVFCSGYLWGIFGRKKKTDDRIVQDFSKANQPTSSISGASSKLLKPSLVSSPFQDINFLWCGAFAYICRSYIV